MPTKRVIDPDQIPDRKFPGKTGSMYDRHVFEALALNGKKIHELICVDMDEANRFYAGINNRIRAHNIETLKVASRGTSVFIGHPDLMPE